MKALSQGKKQKEPKINHADPKHYLAAGQQLSPEQTAQEREAIEQCLGQAYRDAVARCGMSPEEMALQRLEQLKAKKISHIKLRGRVEIKKEVGKNYREVVVSTQADNDEEIETVIECQQPDWQVRERAISAIEALMGYNLKEEERNRGTVIVVNSQIPEPRPAVSDETLEKLWAHRKGEEQGPI